MNNLKKVDIPDIRRAREFIKDIGCDTKSIDIMAPKAVFRTLAIENVNPVDAIIIKQDMLSIGGEVAIPKDVFELNGGKCRILLMGTLRQLEELVRKLYRHHSRIKSIARELEEFVKGEYERTEDKKEEFQMG